MSTSAYTSPTQQREQREQRKDKFLSEFNQSPRCVLLKAKLKKAVLRIAVEKYHKTVPSTGLTQAQKDKFKADLYCFLTEQMRAALDLVFKYNATNLHPDIAQAREVASEDKRRQRDRCFVDPSARTKAERLLREFDTIGDKDEAEKQLLILCTAPQNKDLQTEYWEQYSRFAMKYKNPSSAEYYLRQKLNSTLAQESEQGWIEDSVRDRLILASLFVQEGQFRQAK